MDAEDSTDKAQLVRRVVDLDGVKAAGLIDGEGHLRRIHGHAKVFRNGEPVDAQADGGSDEYEDVYLESLGDEYLVVVFDIEADFEPIKKEIDDLSEKIGVSSTGNG